MKLDEILKRLDLKLGMKVLDTRPNEKIKSNDNVYILVKNYHEEIVFKNSDGWFFNTIYVVRQLGKRFKVIENEQDN